MYIKILSSIIKLSSKKASLLFRRSQFYLLFKILKQAKLSDFRPAPKNDFSYLIYSMVFTVVIKT